MSAPPAGDAPGFRVRPVRLDEAAGLLQDAGALIAAGGGRAAAWFALLSLPIVLTLDGQVLTLFLREAYAAVAYTGFTALLEAARRREVPQWRHFAGVFRYGESRVVLMILSGVVPVAIGLAALWAGWGFDATAAYLAAPAGPQGPAERQMAFDRFVAEVLADLPFTFIAPVCALYAWSGSRSMSANLIACVANWRWVLLTGAMFALASQALELLAAGGGLALEGTALLGGFALEFLATAWTLALARRTFPPA